MILAVFFFYIIILVIIFSEIIKAKMENRTAKEFDESEWQGIIQSTSSLAIGVTSSSAGSSHTSNSPLKLRPVVWTDDHSTSSCMICKVGFTLLHRRHHCRRCGKVVCSDCAPAENTRPIPEWGLKDPVRHCKICFRSPAIQWKDHAIDSHGISSSSK
jgi:hypothetical protein